MGNFELTLTIIGIIYGVFLVYATFVRNRFTEALRIDALFIPHPSEKTRVMNLVFGLMLIGYNVYSLLADGL